MPLRPTTHGWRDASTRLSKCETSHAALANTQIGVSPPHAPHITGRWNTQWDLTYNALPPGYALAASALSKQIPPLSAISPAMLCHPDTCWPLPQFPNRSHSSHRPSFAITTSTPPLHGHQSPSALASMHRTSRAAGIRSGISPAMLCHANARHLPRLCKCRRCFRSLGAELFFHR